MKKFTISKSTWRRGGEKQHHIQYGKVALLNEKGFMCCLGFICEQSGVDKKDLLNCAEPNEIPLDCGEQVKFLVCSNEEEDEDYEGNIVSTPYLTDTQLTEEAIAINDNPALSDEERIEQLTELFESEGIVLEFV